MSASKYSQICLCFLLLALNACRKPLPDWNVQKDTYAESLANHLYQTRQELAAFRFMDSFYSISDNKSIVGLNLKYRWKIKEWDFLHNGDLNNLNVPIYNDSIILMLEAENKQKQFSDIYAISFISIGDHYKVLGDFKKAFDYYAKGLKFAGDNALSDCIQANMQYRLGMLYYKQEKYHEAKQFFLLQEKNVVICADDWQRFVFKQECLSNIAECYLKLKNFDSAIVYCNKNILFIKDYNAKHPSKEYKAVFYNYAALSVVFANKGEAFAKKNDVDSAEVYLKKSINYIDTSNYDKLYAQKTRLDLAKLYLQVHKLDKADFWLKNLTASLDTLPNSNLQANYYYQLFDYYQQHQQPSRAIQYLQRYYAAKDSARLSDKSLANTNIDARLTEASHKYEIALLTKDNTLKANSIRFTAIALVLAVLLVVVIVVAYGRKRKLANQLAVLNSQNETQRMALEAAVEARDKIMRVVVHDMRNPLTAIATVTQNILDSKDDDEPDKQRLQLVHRAASGTLNLIQELLEESKKVSVHQLNKQLIVLQPWITQTVQLYQAQLQQKHIQLALVLPDIPITIAADTDKLERVISNLISNASKFSKPSDTITISLAEEDTNKVLLCVKDEGIGIPQQALASLFNTFTKASRVGTSGEASFGLGLSICKDIVEAHGGTITVTTEEGKGSKFCIVLPKE